MIKCQAFYLRLAVIAAISVAVRPAAAIVGSATEASDHSHVVMVLNRQGHRAGFCTGIVVAPDVVMTAAHCVPKGSDLRVHFPSSAGDPVMLPVVGVAVHPDYRADAIKLRERSIDLALIHLERPLPSPFQPATLSRSAGAKLGARFVIMGYGVGREDNAASSGILRVATLATRAPLSAVLLWSDDPDKRGTGACTGDSGGSVAVEGSSDISAIILWSAGVLGHRCGDLTQSLWLSPHRAWIDQVLAGWKTARPE